METTPVDSADRPIRDITINEIVVFVDPFEEFKKQQKDKEQEEKVAEAKKREETDDQKTTWTGKRLREAGKSQGAGDGLVGKYLHQKEEAKAADEEDEIVEVVEDEPYYQEPISKKAKSKGGFGNFDAW